MREILFKAKRLNNGEWIEGYYLRNGDRCYICPYICFASYRGDNVIRFGNWYEVDPETVCQYTGLKDKNRKRIFEGDILCQKGFGYYYKEKKSKVALNHDWNCGCCNGVYGYFTEGDLDLADCTEAEVIGTIFDNPELLEVTE